MPELPEMETYRRLLDQQLSGKIITDIEINREKSLNITSEVFTRELKGKRIIEFGRRAKYLIFKLDSGNSLLLHLMLAGWLYLGNDEDNPARTKQVIISFGDRRLYFIGLRLGYLHLLDELALQQALAGLGPDPLDVDFSFPLFQKVLTKIRGKLKTTLIDQKVISGIGSLYSDEICFDAKIRPTVTLDSLNDDNLLTLYNSIRTVLKKAVSLGGYMEDPLFSGDKLTGGYNSHTLVYDREGEKCQRCRGTIIKTELSSRKCFYCPDCQPG